MLWQKFLGFEFCFFVDDVMSGIGLGFLAEVIGPWTPTSRGKYLAQVVSAGNLVISPKIGNFNLTFEPETLES